MYILKCIGTGREPVNEFWMEGKRGTRVGPGLNLLGFSRNGRPHVPEGARVVLYASGKLRLVAAGTITSEPEFQPAEHNWADNEATSQVGDPDRWPWVVTWEPRLIVPYVSNCPHLDEVGIDRLSVRSHSYITITRDQYEATVEALAKAALN